MPYSWLQHQQFTHLNYIGEFTTRITLSFLVIYRLLGGNLPS